MKSTLQNVFIVLLFTISSIELKAQTPDINWVTQFGQNAGAVNFSIADAQGNSYVLSTVSATYNITIGGTTLTSFGAADVYFMKLDQSGAVVWVKQFGGVGQEGIGSIALSSTNEILISGSYNGTVDFNPSPIVTNESTSNGSSDAFVVKFDNDGNYLWHKSYGGTLADGISKAKFDADDNVIGSIVFQGAIDMNPGGTPQLFTSAGNSDGAVIKLTNAGNYSWSGQIESTGNIYTRDFTTDQDGNIYLVGLQFALADFDPSSAVNSLTPVSTGAMFVTKWNSAGAYQWAEFYDNNASISDRFSVKIDNNGDVVIGGTAAFGQDWDWGPNVMSSQMSSYSGARHLFIYKVAPNKDFIFIQPFGTPSFGSVQFGEIAIGSDNSIYFSGTGPADVDFDPSAGQSFLPTAAPITHLIFWAKLNSSGELEWADAIGVENTVSNPANFRVTISLDDAQNLYVSSQFNIEATFGVNSNLEVRTANNTEGFIMKIGDNCLIDVSTTLGSTTITANSTIGSYQWIDCSNGNAIISGATSQSFTPTVTGNYAVVIENGSCIDTSICQLVTIATSSLTELDGSQIQLYPNPANEIVYLTGLEAGHEMRILSLNGTMVSSTKDLSNETSLSVAQLENGVYFIHIYAGDKFVTAKKLSVIR